MDDNNLEVGDACVFELIKSGKVSLKVSIYRDNEIRNCSLVLWSNVEKNREMGFSLKKIKTLIGEEKAKSCTLQVGDKTWPVMLLIYPSQARFSVGWAAFRNCLKAGYTCVFEIIEKSSGTMKVSVIRTKDMKASFLGTSAMVSG